MVTPTFIVAPAVLARCGCRHNALSGATPARRGQRPGKCGLRASAAPPRDNSDQNQNSASGSGADAARAALEAAFRIDLEKEGSGNGGKCSCIWCSGSGKRTCAWCKGEGSRNEFRNKSWGELTADVERYMEGQPVELPEQIPTVCSACTGTKVLPCGYCRGSGIGSYGMGYGN
jgi:hypothetical protein